jgi:hypothetical protein
MRIRSPYSVETLWTPIAATPEQVAVPDWHRQLVRDRLEKHRKDPAAGRSRGEIRDGLLQDLAEPSAPFADAIR